MCNKDYSLSLWTQTWRRPCAAVPVLVIRTHFARRARPLVLVTASLQVLAHRARIRAGYTLAGVHNSAADAVLVCIAWLARLGGKHGRVKKMELSCCKSVLGVTWMPYDVLCCTWNKHVHAFSCQGKEKGTYSILSAITRSRVCTRMRACKVRTWQSPLLPWPHSARKCPGSHTGNVVHAAHSRLELPSQACVSYSSSLQSTQGWHAPSCSPPHPYLKWFASQ
jgi:hypothetical protein